MVGERRHIAQRCHVVEEDLKPTASSDGSSSKIVEMS